MFEGTAWGIEGRLLFVMYSGLLKLEDVQMGARRTLEAIELDPKLTNIHVVTILKNISMDATLLHLAEVNASLKSYITHPQLGWTLIIDRDVNPSLQTVARIISEVGNMNYRFFTSLEAGMKFLHETDAALQSLTLTLPNDLS
jgi:hypothetical protein